MNDETDDLDQADEDILTYTVSDEALEALAGTEGVGRTQTDSCNFLTPRGTWILCC
jgi:hypothetical protein